MTDPIGYVYLVWAEGTDRYKIGSAGYPAKRLRELQTGSPIKLQLIAEKESSDYERQEKLQHQRWKDQRVHGEWFRFHPTQMPEVLGGFDLIDTWSSNRIELMLDELMKVAFHGHEEFIKEHLAKLKSFSLKAKQIKEDAYNKESFKLKRLAQELDPNAAVKILDEFARFDFDYDVARLKDRYPSQYQTEVGIPKI